MVLYCNTYCEISEMSVRLGERCVCVCTCVSVHLAPNVVDVQTNSILVVIAAYHEC